MSPLPLPLLRRTRRLAIAAGIIVAALFAAGAPASAQDEIVPSDAATGYDHVNTPPPGAFSTVDWCFAFDDPALIGQQIQVTAIGLNATVMGIGEVGTDGTAIVRVGITEGGDYTVVSITASGGGIVVPPENVLSVSVVFDPPIVDCLGAIRPADVGQGGPTPTRVPEPTATATPTATPAAEPEPEEETPTEVPEATAVAEPTAAPEPTSAPAPTGDDGDDDGSNLPWIGVGLGGLVLALLGAVLIGRAKPAAKGNCDDEKAAWDAAEDSFAEAVDAIDEAEKTLSDATETRKSAAKALRKAEADIPPDPNGDSVTDERTGETVTSLDRWLRNRYAQAEYDAYQNNPSPETARAFEDAMRAADTPEAREARRQAADQARQAAVPLRAAFEAAQRAEREADAALGRRHRDVASERRFADEAKARYEECIKAQAEFDERAREGRKRYDEAVERDRRRRSGEGGGPTAPPAVAPPPAPGIGGPCSPIGSTTNSTKQFNGSVIGDNDTVTITIVRSHGTFENDELEADSGDELLNLFGAGRGADSRTAVFTMPAAQAARLAPKTIVDAFDARQRTVADDIEATLTRRMDVTFSWYHHNVNAACTRQLRCEGSGWTSTGPGTFTQQAGPITTVVQTVELGDNNATAALGRISSMLQTDVNNRNDLLNMQLACDS